MKTLVEVLDESNAVKTSMEMAYGTANPDTPERMLTKVQMEAILNIVRDMVKVIDEAQPTLIALNITSVCALASIMGYAVPLALDHAVNLAEERPSDAKLVFDELNHVEHMAELGVTIMNSPIARLARIACIMAIQRGPQ